MMRLRFRWLRAWALLVVWVGICVLMIVPLVIFAEGADRYARWADHRARWFSNVARGIRRIENIRRKAIKAAAQ